MAFEEDVFDITFIAGEALTSSQYHYVYLTADNTVKTCSHATSQKAIGILQNAPASGGLARVRLMGVSRAYIGTANVAFGDKCGTDASGHCITKDTDKYYYCGICIQGGSSTEKATVLLYGPKMISK